ncbi:MAG: hypothetical protein ACK40X_01855 [Armatimonadota bacterium]
MSIAHYLAVVRKKRLPFWQQSKLLTVGSDLKLLSAEQLWQLHDELIRSLHTAKWRFREIRISETRIAACFDPHLFLTVTTVIATVAPMAQRQRNRPTTTLLGK